MDMDKIKDKQKLSWQGMFYTVQRLDLLIISISGAGIYVCLETLKFLKEKEIELHLLVKIAGFVLLLAIMINFLSQILGYWANYFYYLSCDEQLEDKPSTIKIKKLDDKSDFYTKWNKISNLTSAIIMFLGLLTLIFYFMFNF